MTSQFEYNSIISAKWFLLVRRNTRSKKQFSQLNETLNDFLIGKNTNAERIENESLELQTIGPVDNSGRFTVGEHSASQAQVFERNIAEYCNISKIGKAVDNVVMIFENRVHDAILTAISNVIMPGVERAVRLITELSGRKHNSVLQDRDQRDFSGNSKNAPVFSASSRVDFNIDPNKNDETGNVENFEEGDISGLKTSFDRQAHARHRNLVFVFLFSGLALFVWSTMLGN